MNLHEPIFIGNELKYIKRCFKENLISIGTFVNKFEDKIKKYLSIKYAVAVNSGTSALHISLKIAGAKIKTEVIAPSITFIAPINAILYNNATPIFMDVDNNLNIDAKKTIDFINRNTFYKNNYTFNKKTKNKIVAIIIVHVFGNAAEIYNLVKICKERNIKVIEDSSESLGTKYKEGYLKNKFTGTIGDINCLSFNGNKIITSGGGGMIITNNNSYYKKAKYLINQAKDDSIKYIHNEIGFNYRLSNIHSAIGLAQMEKISYFLKKKKEIHEMYKKHINKINGLSILEGPEYSLNNYWLNILRINKKIYKIDSYKLTKHLINNNIFIRNVWYPNHMQKKMKIYEKFEIKNSLKLCLSSLCLPSSVFLKEKDIKKISRILNE